MTHHQKGTNAMTTTQSSASRSTPEVSLVARLRTADPAEQAFMILRAAFTVAPILFGVDKFFHLMVNWDRYLAPALSDPLPFTPHQLMYAVGVTEIIAGVLVAIHPRLGGPVVAAWLLGIIVNLLLIPGFYDVALRDFGLFLAAIALARLATRYDPRPLLWISRGH
jgi:uncharacterized membrane protein YphA (DoxX/SURF4 family)